MKKINYISAIFGIILSLLIFHNSFSQVNQEWVARYNGTGDTTDFSASAAVDDSGNVYVTGYSYGSGTASDYLTIKYNSAGDSVWVRRYNGPGNDIDRAASIAVDISGNVYVTGVSYDTGSIIACATIKYNSEGIQQWIGRISNRDGVSIVVDGSGNSYVTGGRYGGSIFTVKYSPDGTRLWLSGYGSSHSSSSSIAVDGSGNVYVTGDDWDGSASLLDYVTMKYNSDGARQWLIRYNSSDFFDDRATDIALDSSGNVYVTGSRHDENTYGTIKYNSEGVQQWVSTYGYNGGASSIAVDKSGNVYVTGNSSGGFNYDYATIKYNTEGVQQWASRYNGPGNSGDEANCIALDTSGNIYVTGNIDGSGILGGNYGTIKYNAQGVQQWIEIYDGSGNSYEYSLSIATDISGNVYVTGASTGIGTSFDYATIKYSQATGIRQISSLIPLNISLLQNYPNPFNPITHLEFGISDLGFVTLKVYDILGKEVTTLVYEKLSAGNYKVEFDGSRLPSGIYFYRLVVSLSNPITAGEFTDTKRM